jgi:isopenicillin N synthase-like dioxygenase
VEPCGTGPSFDLEPFKIYSLTSYSRYTPLGSYAGVFENTKDGNESIKVCLADLFQSAEETEIENQITDEAMRADPPILPDLFSENKSLFERFICGSRSITTELLSYLSDIMGLQNEARFERSHRSGVPANCSLNLFCYPKTPKDDSRFGQNKHTDNGSFTLLFSDQPGLEMLSPTIGIWGRVLPKAGHAVVNVGDTLRFLSGQTFRSAVHRVIPTFESRQQQRLAVGYFLRAEDAKVFRNNEGKMFTAREWHDQKYANYKAPHTVQRTNSILTGGMESSKSRT